MKAFNEKELQVGDIVFHVIARKLRKSIIEYIYEDGDIKMEGIKTLIPSSKCIKI